MATISASVAGSPNIPLFLDLIAISEGTSTSPITKNDGYDVEVTAADGPRVFTDYADHPFGGGRAPTIVRRNPLLQSTAAGRYQILYRYFEDYKASLRLPDFSPISQDRVAIQMLRERGAISHIVEGDIIGAITLASSIWASFPGNNYGQNPHSMDTLMAKWASLQSTSASPTGDFAEADPHQVEIPNL